MSRSSLKPPIGADRRVGRACESHQFCAKRKSQNCVFDPKCSLQSWRSCWLVPQVAARSRSRPSTGSGAGRWTESVNGTVVFAEMFEAAGHHVSSWRFALAAAGPGRLHRLVPRRPRTAQPGHGRLVRNLAQCQAAPHLDLRRPRFRCRRVVLAEGPALGACATSRRRLPPSEQKRSTACRRGGPGGP